MSKSQRRYLGEWVSWEQTIKRLSICGHELSALLQTSGSFKPRRQRTFPGAGPPVARPHWRGLFRKLLPSEGSPALEVQNQPDIDLNKSQDQEVETHRVNDRVAQTIELEPPQKPRTQPNSEARGMQGLRSTALRAAVHSQEFFVQEACLVVPAHRNRT